VPVSRRRLGTNLLLCVTRRSCTCIARNMTWRGASSFLSPADVLVTTAQSYGVLNLRPRRPRMRVCQSTSARERRPNRAVNQRSSVCAFSTTTNVDDTVVFTVEIGPHQLSSAAVAACLQTAAAAVAATAGIYSINRRSIDEAGRCRLHGCCGHPAVAGRWRWTAPSRHAVIRLMCSDDSSRLTAVSATSFSHHRFSTDAIIQTQLLILNIGLYSFFFFFSSLHELAGSWLLVVMTPFRSILCCWFQFTVAKFGVSFCHDPIQQLHPRFSSCFYRAMLAQSAVMRLHVVRLSVCNV